MRKLALVMSLILVIGLFAACGNKDQDKVVFEGDNISVTVGEVDYFYIQLKAIYELQYGYGDIVWSMPVDETSTTTFGEMIRENLKNLTIRYAIMEKMAQDKGMKLSDEQIETIKANAIQEVSIYNQFSEAVRDKFLVTEELSIKMQKMGDLAQLLYNELTKDFVVDEALYEEDLAAHEEYQKINEIGVDTYNQQIRARHILIKNTDEEGNPIEGEALEERKALAEELRQRALDGEDFAALATEYTEDLGSKETGGEYTFGRGTMVKEFEEASFALEVGGISELVETQFGYHIIKLEEVFDVTEEQKIAAQNRLTSIEEDLRSMQKQDYFESIIDEEVNKITITVDEELWAKYVYETSVTDAPAAAQ